MVGMNLRVNLRLSFKCTVSPTLCIGSIIILRNNKALRSDTSLWQESDLL